jgi:hypothetical protein
MKRVLVATQWTVVAGGRPFLPLSWLGGVPGESRSKEN